MNIAICEDNLEDAMLIRAYLQHHFKQNGYTGKIHQFQQGESLLEAFSPGVFDAVFLDIYLDKVSGMDIAKQMRKEDPNFALIFITNSRDHAIEAYALRACAYVAKPLDRQQMDVAFQQCQNIFIKNAKFIEVAADHHLLKIPLSKILYLEAYDKEILCHTSVGTIKTSTSLSSLEKAIETIMPKVFFRCHRSYLINLNHISQLNGQDILMSNGDLIPIPYRGRGKCREVYGQFLSDCLFE